MIEISFTKLFNWLIGKKEMQVVIMGLFIRTMRVDIGVLHLLYFIFFGGCFSGYVENDIGTNIVHLYQ